MEVCETNVCPDLECVFMCEKEHESVYPSRVSLCPHVFMRHRASIVITVSGMESVIFTCVCQK